MKRALALLVLVGCGTSYSDPNVKQQSYDFRSNTFSLSWTPAAGPVDHYVIEAGVEPAAVAEVAQAPATATSATVALGGQLEDTIVHFRIRAEPGARYAQETNLSVGIEAPEVSIGARSQPTAPVVVSWTRNSRRATSLVLQRRVVQYDGTASSWVQLAASGDPSGVYTDTDLSQYTNLAAYEYSAIAVLPNGDSATSDPADTGKAPAAQSSLQAEVVTPGQTQLTIHNGSASRETMYVECNLCNGSARCDAPPIFTLQAQATATYQVNSTQPGFYCYFLSVSPDVSGAGAVVLVNRTSPTDMQGTMFQLANTSSLVRTPAGWSYAYGDDSGTHLIPPGGGPSEAFTTRNGVSRLVVDPQGTVHVLSFDSAKQGPTAVTHLFAAGHVWQSEPVGTAYNSTEYNGFRLDVQPDGTLVGYLWGATLLKRPGGAWASPGIADPYIFSLCARLLDARGTWHWFATNPFGFVKHYYYDASGAVQTEATPMTTYCPAAYAMKDGSIALVDSYQYSIHTDAGWAPVTQLTPKGTYYSTSFHAPDGSRFGMYDSDGDLWLVGSDGVAKHQTFQPPSLIPGLVPGFDVSGKAWMAAFVGSDGLGAVFEETP
jgi:hypothetical protein